MNVRGPKDDDRNDDQRRLMLWCNRAIEYHTKADHMAVDARVVFVSPLEELTDNLLKSADVHAFRDQNGL